MVYSNNFVVVIKVGGKVLRENSDGSVYIPFGSEYSILLKNKNSRTAVVTVEIDGDDTLNGNEIVVSANSSTELTGFMKKDGKVSNRFKFLEKTAEISAHRGDKSDDGLVRVEYRFERAVPSFWPISYRHFEMPVMDHNVYYASSTLGSSLGANKTVGASTHDVQLLSSSDVNYACGVNINLPATGNCLTPIAKNLVANEDGFTAKGSKSGQVFQTTHVGPLEADSYVICLKLKGGDIITGRRVTKAKVVRRRVKCESCGKACEQTWDFCPRCTTALKDFS